MGACLADRPRRGGPARRAAAAAALVIGLAGGWGCPPRPQPRSSLVFYPPPPNEPHAQFLRAVSAARDVVGPPSAFRRFVLGEGESRREDNILRPYGLAFRGGRLWVCDSGARRLLVLDFAGRSVRSFGGEGAFTLGLPINVALGPDGEKYVTDTQRGQIVVYDAADRPVRALSRKAAMKPCDVLWYEGELFVADLASNSILVLDPRGGRVLRTLGEPGSKPGRFFKPTNLAMGPKGSLYVSDTLNARVQVISPRSGAVVKVIGSLGRRLGQMVRPKGIAVDRAGRLYVADAATDSVQLFDPQGRLLMVLGGPGDGPGCLSLPAKVAISYEGVDLFAGETAPGFRVEYLVFVASQLGPNKISIYGFGRHVGEAPSRLKRIELRERAPHGKKEGGA